MILAAPASEEIMPLEQELEPFQTEPDEIAAEYDRAASRKPGSSTSVGCSPESPPSAR